QTARSMRPSSPGAIVLASGMRMDNKMRTYRMVFFLFAIFLAACGTNSTPANRPATLPSTNPLPAGTSAPPNAAPTQALTPPGLPPGGFPPLDRPLAGQIIFSNGDGDIYLID